MKLLTPALQKKVVLQEKTPEHSFPIVAIGASAGGLEAVSELLRNLPANTGMAYIYVQHLSPDHKSFLTPILSKVTKMKVQEIENMEHMAPNNVYVIPHNKGIEVIDGQIQLIPRLKISTGSLTIDVLFSSLAETHKENVIGIVLSGYASDGAIGLKTIKAAGGLTFAQDDSAQASSMPESAIAVGAVDFVMSPKKIAQELVKISKNGFLRTIIKLRQNKNTLEENNFNLKTIFELLHKQTGVDFSHYKMSTIKRRLRHRMLQTDIHTVEEFTEHLLKNTAEVDLLYKDLLIHVSSFFRETETFKYLQTAFLPKLIASKHADETLRIWVTACSSGEEAYSIAMLISEIQSHNKTKIPVQIFATDLSEEAIRIARIGEYTQKDVSVIAKKRVSTFFTKTGDTYRIAKEIREMCIFAPHNVLSDPPFARIDFISCCNLLIYFDMPAQKRALATFNFALNDGGYLMLGKSETIGAASPFFTRIDTKFKVYSRKKNTGIRKVPDLLPRIPRTAIPEKSTKPVLMKSTAINSAELDKSIDAILLTNYMPACAIINKDMEILQFRGSTSVFLEHASGRASLNILKMIKPEFAFELRSVIHKALKSKTTVRKSDIEMKIGANYKMISLEVCPLKIDWDEPLLLIVFTIQEQVEKYIGVGKDKRLVIGTKEQEQKIKRLSEELALARAEMHTIIESQEIAYEELQAANEEITSTNEEFQTLNEELETSKEEIEATNEELICTNHELQIRNDLLTESYRYSEAIIATIHEPMIVLDSNLHVKSANKSFYKKFRTTKEDTEGVLVFELGNKQWDIRQLHLLLENIVSKNSDFNSFEVTHTFPGIGEKIMLLNAHRIVQKIHHEHLILLAFEDITERANYYLNEKAILSREKQIAEMAVHSKQQFLSNMSHEIRTPMNAIIGFTKVVLKTDLTEKQKEYVNAIKVSCDDLIVLINDILDLAKVDAGKMTFEQSKFAVLPSITAILHLFETKIQEKSLELITVYDTTIPKVVLGDAVRLNQIILNLVSNAIKFTEKGKITVSVRKIAEDEEGTTIEFAVKDTGIGIPADKLPSIFQKFQQASSSTARLYGGTGLGLAIAKQLVEAQGGTIKVESENNIGSTFTFTLAFQKTTEEIGIETEDVASGSEFKHLKVLVVEDIQLNQLLMKTILDDFGFEGDIAANGKIAIELLKHKSYDVILMDLQMPEMDGFEATEYIRKTLGSTVPIIALTADVTTVDLAKCKAVGMNDYLAKPVDERLLYRKIVGLVKKTTTARGNKTKNKAVKKQKTDTYTNLDYLVQRTKSNPALLAEIISLYLKQNPLLIAALKQSLVNKDWHAMHMAAHKMIPSFSIMGFSNNFEDAAKKIQEYASAKEHLDKIPDLVAQLDKVCTDAYIELEDALTKL